MGVDQKALVSQRLSRLLSAPSRIFYETNISPLLRMQGAVDEVAMDFRGADVAKVQCLVNAVEERDTAGTLVHTHLAIFRATERRRYERSLVDTHEATERAVIAEREASKLREQFIAVLGHDLRNPLASINSGVELITERETLTPRGQHILSLMRGSIMRASELVDNVLDFARGRLGGGLSLTLDAQQPLGPLLEQVVAEIVSVAPGRQIGADIIIPHAVNCDRVRMGQMLSNLLGNAVTHGSKTHPITVQARTTDETLTISVSNGGLPIDAATREKLFHPFFRGDVRPNQVGLGLGLHIAAEIAKAHGGTLDVASDSQETCFTFAMPLTSAQVDC
ncbi:sensor histidine kinase [Sphingomonas sp. PAMC 26617]|uniref:sensor histidine kinase n=1 Tax=Sphingomonas sp. PAMC 26617 TaxID=1112216 RepID=UPI0002891EDA|nr:HAMP domain-containing sensor histidine kinase [Sphingomonas sp. PAMC 26617]